MAIARKVQLVTSDDETFEVDRDVIKQSATVNTLILDLGLDDDDSSSPMPIPLPKVTAEHFRLVQEWCEHHKADAPVEEEKDDNDENKEWSDEEKKSTEIPEWDRKFLEQFHRATVFHLTLAANYLDIKVLLKYCCKFIASMMKGKDAEGIRQIFGVKNDFTPEELEAIKKDNAWCPSDSKA